MYVAAAVEYASDDAADLRAIAAKAARKLDGQGDARSHFKWFEKVIECGIAFRGRDCEVVLWELLPESRHQQ